MYVIELRRLNRANIMEESTVFAIDNLGINYKSAIGRRMSKFANSRDDNVVQEPSLLEKRLIEAFEVFDNAKNGEVDVRELGTIIRFLGCVITEAELQEIQVEVEDVENNCVHQSRFVEYMCKAIGEHKFKPADPIDLLKAFQLLDKDNRGYIMRDDLERALMEVGEPFSKEEINEMMVVACESGTKKINYEHYINLLIVKIPDEKNLYSIFEREQAEKVALVPKKHVFDTILLEAD